MRNRVAVSLAAVACFSAFLPVHAEPVCITDTEIGNRLNLPVYQWIDEDMPVRGIIVAVHGLTFYATAYDKLARHLASKGYVVYATDLRGFGRWKEEPAKFKGDDRIHFTASKDDLVRVINELRNQNPDKKIVCMGESLGANYALWLLSNGEGKELDGAVLSAPCVKTCIHPRARWVVDFLKGLAHPKTQMDLTPYVAPYLSHDQKLTQECLEDKKICRRLSPEELIKAHLTNKIGIKEVEKIRSDMPILIVAGKKDLVFKSAALKDLVRRMGSRLVAMKILPDKGHLLLEHQEVDAEITATIDSWLDLNTQSAVAKQPERPTTTVTVSKPSLFKRSKESVLQLLRIERL